MIKCLILSGLLFTAIACNQSTTNQTQSALPGKSNSFRQYSKEVSDSFTISINLPNNYGKEKDKKYPVVYLLDANLYFDIIAAVLKKYEDVGLAPAVVLVGIGYKDFPTMDSLRSRDDTYPIAIPEYEMSISGGADKFLSFINTELIPNIDKEYRTDTSKRVLMGHSLGGYFTAYAFLQYQMGKADRFNNYIAASPSIHYNKYWLLNQLKENSSPNNTQKKANIYITYGGLEDAESQTDSTILKLADLTKQLSGSLSGKQSGSVNYKTDIFSNLDHMDTQLPTFLKGLQWTLAEEGK